MSAGNRDNILISKNMLSQPLGARRVDETIVEHIFNTGITSGQGIADNNQIRRRLQLLRIKAFGQLNSRQL